MRATPECTHTLVPIITSWWPKHGPWYQHSHGQMGHKYALSLFYSTSILLVNKCVDYIYAKVDCIIMYVLTIRIGKGAGRHWQSAVLCPSWLLGGCTTCRMHYMASHIHILTTIDCRFHCNTTTDYTIIFVTHFLGRNLYGHSSVC